MSNGRALRTVVMLLLAVFALSLTGCQQTKTDSYPSKPITFLVPFGPGGGMDTTARAAAKVMVDEKIITQSVPVENRAGGGGSVGMSYIIQHRKNDNYTLLFHSAGILLNKIGGQTEIDYQDVTPIAKLLSDFNIFCVKSDSTLQNINDVMSMLKNDPKSLIVGGTSEPGGNDHINFMIAAKEFGIDIKNVEYITFDGSGELVAALLNGTIQVMSAGVNDIIGQLEAGNFRALGVMSDNRYEHELLKDIPTMKEQGINVSYETWRGVFGPPEMSEESKEFLEDAFEKLIETDAWKQMLVKYNWTNSFMGSDEFNKFLEEQNQTIEEFYTEMGLK
ncbi:MAG TPA: tripartite tricarboxylate transporter substrate binding protein [Thermoanaerobacterales bacterium]|nr:tripartite tricarboxylate transporter substrate binding protein [Thermoanaerobacterales bacterium]